MGPREFDARRLTLARWAAGVTKRDLADQIELSPSSITQYEAGHTRPPDTTIARLALSLGVPTEYFFRAPGRRQPLSESRSFFRSLRSTRQWERDQADARAEHVYDVVDYLEQWLQLPEVQVPEYSLGIEQASRDAAEAVTERAREAWAMPPGPVGNVVRLLEAHGVIVVRLRSTSARLDAFSRWFDKRPIVLLWDGKDDKGRSRFDAAHELAHLVMHHEPELGGRAQERQAHAFASAFLMPAESIVEELPRRPPRGADWDYLAGLRERWGVSIAALLYRARELGTISESGFRRAMTRLTEAGLRHHDGDFLGPPEQPQLLGDAVRALKKLRGFDLEDLARELSFSRAQLDDVLGGQLTQASGPQRGKQREAGPGAAPDVTEISVLSPVLP